MKSKTKMQIEPGWQKKRRLRRRRSDFLKGEGAAIRLGGEEYVYS